MLFFFCVNKYSFSAIHAHHHPSLREQLQFTNIAQHQHAYAVNTSSGGGGTGGGGSGGGTTTPGAPKTLLGRLGIRKPSILSLSSPHPSGGATARTFSLDDLLRPPPRRKTDTKNYKNKK